MARMYGEDPQIQSERPQISLVQILSVVCIIMVTLVLPAQLITYVQTRNTPAPYTLTAVEERNNALSSQAQIPVAQEFSRDNFVGATTTTSLGSSSSSGSSAGATFTSNTHTSNSMTPQVAGAATRRDSIITIPGTSIAINLTSSTGIYIIAGIILVALALLAAIYLLATG